MSIYSSAKLTKCLNESPRHQMFVRHAFFRRITDAPIDKEQVSILIGQWWHPLHYFPTFLARSISVLPDIESKSAISKILNQETGEGNPNRAHELIYINSMERAGFTRAQATEAVPFAETSMLVAGYEKASNDRFSALGFIFATEVTDLLMVSSLGTAVRRVTGVSDIEWVNIHIEQEPNHVEEADRTMKYSFKAGEEAPIIESADRMWALWAAFFDRLEAEALTATFSAEESHRKR